MSPARLLLDTLRFHGSPPSAELAAAWRAGDVRGLRRLVALEGCAIWLYRRLRQLGVLEATEPDFAEWLSATARTETARNLLIEAEALALAEIFGRWNVPFVFLKGVARWLTADRYPLGDARASNDVDVLVAGDQAQAVWRELLTLGYVRTRPSAPRRPQHHHLPALWSERRVAIELHTTFAPGVAPGEAWRRHYSAGIELERAGVRVRVPPATELFWNGAAHGLLLPDVAFLLALLFDAAVIWASGAAIDWGEVRRRLDAGEIRDRTAAAAWLGAARDLAGVEPPVELVGRIEPYNLERVLALRLAVLRRLEPPSFLWKVLVWWTSERGRRAP